MKIQEQMIDYLKLNMSRYYYKTRVIIKGEYNAAGIQM